MSTEEAVGLASGARRTATGHSGRCDMSNESCYTYDMYNVSFYIYDVYNASCDT